MKLLDIDKVFVQGGKVDIVERCGASGYPIGCVLADVYCKIEEMKRRRKE